MLLAMPRKQKAAGMAAACSHCARLVSAKGRGSSGKGLAYKLTYMRSMYVRMYVCGVDRLGNECLDLVVADEDKGAAQGAQHVRSETLEHRRDALVLDDLDGAVERAVVEPLILGLLGLHLQAAANGVEGVRDEAGDDGRELGDAELGDEANRAPVVLVRVERLEGVKNTKVRATVSDDAHNGDAEASVHGENTALCGGLHQAVSEAVELGVARANI